MALAAAALVFGAAGPAAAQIGLGPVNGIFTAHVGSAIGRDGTGSTLSAGGSVAVIEQSGWGAEFDAGFASDDRGRTGGLDVQSYVLNVIGMWPRGRVRPFAVGGGGAIRARSCVNACAATEAWTDWALSGGGGVQYLLNEVFGLRGEARYFSMTGRHPDPSRESIRFWRIAVGGTFQWVAD
jgi:hypothetical protein